jgi:hypothetical protein
MPKAKKKPALDLNPHRLGGGWADSVQTSLRSALEDPRLLGDALPGDSWAAWRALLLAAMGEPLQPDELEHFRRLTGRENPPTQRIEEFWGIIGRRGGKSRAIAVLIAYLATLCDYRMKLSSGEIGVVLCIAPSQTQSQIVLNYIAGILEGSPILAQLIRKQTSETIELSNRIIIDVRSASFRRLRGQTCVAVVADEAAFWYSDESSNPDTEILDAVRPSLGTTSGPLIVISSPYARRGAVWEAFRQHFGPAGDPLILVARGATRDLNPSFDQKRLDREYERDPAHAAAEYGGEFRTDIEGFITSEAVEACVDQGVREREYSRQYEYSAFVDPSGGSHDSFTLAVAHKEGKTSVLDLIREVRPPFNAEQTVDAFSSLLREYKCYTVWSDKYAGEWPKQAFAKCGVTLEHSERTKLQIYQEALPLINSGNVALLEHSVLRHQLVSLERKTTRGGRDAIDHAPGGRDDVANAACGALVMAGERPGDPRFWAPIEYPKMGIV